MLRIAKYRCAELLAGGLTQNHGLTAAAAEVLGPRSGTVSFFPSFFLLFFFLLLHFFPAGSFTLLEQLLPGWKGDLPGASHPSPAAPRVSHASVKHPRTGWGGPSPSQQQDGISSSVPWGSSTGPFHTGIQKSEKPKDTKKFRKKAEDCAGPRLTSSSRCGLSSAGLHSPLVLLGWRREVLSHGARLSAGWSVSCPSNLFHCKGT